MSTLHDPAWWANHTDEELASLRQRFDEAGIRFAAIGNEKLAEDAMATGTAIWTQQLQRRLGVAL